ncbi:uncharacterized protein LOC126559015 [Anopheles maculipalpis]|uniref:uncharacterized protein LOC126559015 n=1 Tax=Anopheles maculipalpis TaxID=1496333 RepID=UPI00215905FD|nr:uncharacterized protein LOC126559015 [Anopheles maculipalpis]
MAVLELLWNCLLLMLFLGVLKAALSFYWPSIGEWRYDDLHPSLRYRESCRANQLLVNGVFFIVYPCVLGFRWYTSPNRATLWTECCVEKDEFERYVEYSREEEDLLRHGMIRGRIIIQKEIVLAGASEDDGSSYRKYDNADDCIVGVEREPRSNERNEQSKCEPLNLSKDGEGCDLNNEENVFMQQCREDPTRVNTFHTSTEEEGDDDEIRLIPPSSRQYEPSSSAFASGANR